MRSPRGWLFYYPDDLTDTKIHSRPASPAG
jgi:hypothetical protein